MWGRMWNNASKIESKAIILDPVWNLFYIRTPNQQWEWKVKQNKSLKLSLRITHHSATNIFETYSI